MTIRDCKTADGKELEFLPALANRHGLITGATGTGKTVTLQVLAEKFSRLGVPVFLADVKGDLSGLAARRLDDPQAARAPACQSGIDEPAWNADPAVFWDVFGRRGFPVRATISDLGPLLLATVRTEPDTAGRAGAGVQDRRRQRTAVAGSEGPACDAAVRGRQRARSSRPNYGNVSTASIGAIQRALLEIEQQGGGKFFGEPMLDVDDLLQTDRTGRGMVNILAAEELIRSPKVYSTFLLWMLSELFEHLPEVGDVEKPTLVFFFDEAHLLFTDAPSALVEKIEQVVRLIRSKGVGVYFVTQSPADIPETRARPARQPRAARLARLYTARSEGGQNGGGHVAAESEARHRLGDHRAGRGRGARLASRREGESDGHRARLDRPAGVANRSDHRCAARRHPERGRGASTVITHKRSIASRRTRSSRRERGGTGGRGRRWGRAGTTATPGLPESGGAAGSGSTFTDALSSILLGTTGPRGGHHDGLVQSAAKSAARSVGSGLGRAILRGALGSILGGTTSRSRSRR